MDLPNIENLNEGDEVRITYVSSRSGNELERSGIVDRVTEADDKAIVYVYEEERKPMKHAYIGLTEMETESGDNIIGAVSMMTELDCVDIEEHPSIGHSYTFTQSVTYKTYLGRVVDVTRTDTSSNFLIA